MASLRTNYKDDILSGDRKYRMITNSDGTVSFQDVTDYTQEGDTFGALDINATNTAVNALQEANGDTDISGIGDGTNTGAIHTLNTHLSRKMDYPNYSTQEQVASISTTITTTFIDLWVADRDCFVRFFTNVTGGVESDGIHIRMNNGTLDLYSHYIKGYMSSGLYPMKRGDVLKVSKDPNVQPAVVVYAFDLID